MKIINHFFPHHSTSPAWSYGFAIAGVGLYCGGSAFASCSLTANLAQTLLLLHISIIIQESYMLKSLMSKQFDSRDCFQFWMQLGKQFFKIVLKLIRRYHVHTVPVVCCKILTSMTPAEQQPARVLSNRLRQYLGWSDPFFNETSNQDQLVATENPPAWVSSLFNLSKPSTTNSHWAGGYKWFQVYAPFMMNF